MLALALLMAYVAGSFPTAYLVGRAVKGVDLRTVGSGNLGATNVYREVGVAAAIFVLAVDAAKGWVAVAAIPRLMSVDAGSWWIAAFGIAAVIGHAKPVFLLWRGGGKGVATVAGIFLSLAPLAVGLAAIAFAIIVAITRYVSAGSVVAALVLPVSVALTRGAASPVFVTSALLSSFVVWMHRENMNRLMQGRERKLGRPGGAH